MNRRTVILADGLFPTGSLPLGYLREADYIVCCDGAVEKLIGYGMEPSVIVGDLDSLSKATRERYSAILYSEAHDQESNDLTKAVNYCLGQGLTEVVILGANGLREDHAIGNASLLLEYATRIKVVMISDYGIFLPMLTGGSIDSFPGQQVSLFSPDPGIKVRSEGLRYPLDNVVFDNWWRGTLNEALGDSFSLLFDHGRILVYLAF